ncbi:MAG TPA: TlpA disulfide reductase family protein [Micromonosporaceae bacterium]|nr:TlpA disulfide reductase family protein [Micromonosporaceae bacterium]
MRRLRTAVLGLVAAFALSACTGSATADTGSGMFPVADRRAAPELRGELLGGGSYDLGEHRDKVVVVNFWASWCPPCRDEADELEASYGATRASGVTFLGINTRDDRDPAKAYLVGHPASYPSLFDPPGRLSVAFKVPPNSIPATLIIDRQGRIAAVYRKALTREELTPAIETVAAEQ